MQVKRWLPPERGFVLLQDQSRTQDIWCSLETKAFQAGDTIRPFPSPIESV